MMQSRILLISAWVLLQAGVLGAGPSGQVLLLGDITAGGDGTINSPFEYTGIDPRTGLFTTDYANGRLFDSNNGLPTPVPASPYIDSVFFLGPPGQGGAFYSQVITQSAAATSTPATRRQRRIMACPTACQPNLRTPSDRPPASPSQRWLCSTRPSPDTLPP